MVEEAMLIANTVVAEALAEKKIPLLYRIHDKPDVTKMKAYEEIAHIMGVDFSASKAVDPFYVQKISQ